MAAPHSTTATPTARPLSAHPGYQRSDLGQLLLELLPALPALLQFASAVRAGFRQLGEQLHVHPLGCLSVGVSTMLRT